MAPLVRRQTSKGLLEVIMESGSATVYLNGQRQGGGAVAPLPTPVTAGGNIFTHYLRVDRTPFALTTEEAAAVTTAIREQHKAHQTRLAENVPGLEEVRAAYASWDAYHDAFQEAVEDDNNPPPVPPGVPAEVAKRYPRAALYLKAESYSRASNDRKATAGQRAMQLLEEGGSFADAQQILANWLPPEAQWD